MPNANSKAAGNFFGLINGEGAGGLNRQILITGQQLSTFDLPLERLKVASAKQVGVLAGRGSVLHRLAIAAERGSKKAVDMYILPVDEEAGGAAATGTLTVAGTATGKGTWGVRLNGDKDLEAQIQTVVDQTAAQAATALYAEVLKLLDSPATAADDTLGVLTWTAKNKGTFGNFMAIEVIGTVPAGLTATVSDMSGGTTDPDIDTALTATANNDANDTALVHGYDIDGTTLDKLSAYNGEGNDFTGLYQKEIGRPFRSMVCDNTRIASEWDTFLADADRKIDRTSGAASLPGCTGHPAEIAAAIIGIMERVNADGPTDYYEGEKLSWLPVPAASERYWELGSDGGYSLRDNAVRTGLTPVIVIKGVYTLQNVNTFYHPDDVEEDENGWMDMSDISISQNILQYFRDKWTSAEWTAIKFVEDISALGSINPDGSALDKSKFRDRKGILTELIDSAKELAGAGWLYNSDYTIDLLNSDPSLVTIRANGYGFDYGFPVWYRLKGYIKNGEGTFNVGGIIAQTA